MRTIRKYSSLEMTWRKQKILKNRDLGRTDEWYVTNGMKRNHKKYKAMVVGKSEANATFMCERTVIPIEREVELLGVVVDSKLKFEGHISKICRKVSQQVAVFNRMKKMLPPEIRKQLYQSFIVPHFN